jgi:hypothetical protein
MTCSPPLYPALPGNSVQPAPFAAAARTAPRFLLFSSRTETQRQWSDLAILRTTPALLGLFSLITLWANRIKGEHGVLPNRVRWYPKADPTFSDALALVRREL